MDPYALRAAFPALALEINGRPIAYLDSASTTQKPRAVLDAIQRAYTRCANVHRGVHQLSERATEAYEAARDEVRAFIGASSRDEIIFTGGTTAAINLVAQSYGRSHVRPGDRVIVSEMEHHSNLVPWQLLCEAQGAELSMLPIDDDGALDLDALSDRLTERTRIVAVAHASNSLGTVNDIAAVAEMTHDAGAVVVVDGAQAVPHFPVDVSALGCDFYAFSGHKLYGPSGIGVLYGRRALLEKMPPWQAGGDMVLTVSFARTTFSPLPYKLEAGTPHIAGAIGLGAAITWLRGIDWESLIAHEAALLARATEALRAQPDVRLLGTAPTKAPVLSFVMDGIHAHDVGTILDLEGVAVRTGHLCTQPVMDRFGVPATTRVSFAAYNAFEDVERLVAGLERVRETFR